MPADQTLAASLLKPQLCCATLQCVSSARSGAMEESFGFVRGIVQSALDGVRDKIKKHRKRHHAQGDGPRTPYHTRNAEPYTAPKPCTAKRMDIETIGTNNLCFEAHSYFSQWKQSI